MMREPRIISKGEMMKRRGKGINRLCEIFSQGEVKERGWKSIHRVVE